MLVDFHTHLDQYSPSALRAAIDCIRENKILTVAASCDIASWKKNLKIAQSASDLIIPTFGVHPSYCAEFPENAGEIITLLEPYLAQSPVIGEIGLDFFWETKIPHKKQELVFRACLDHCERNGKTAVIHTKGAEERICDILRDFPHAKIVIHWYDGSEETFKTYLDRGYFQTFGYETRYSEHIRHLLALTPNELLLSETDNPTGEPWLCEKQGIAGADNSPLLIRRVVKDIASAKQMSEAETESILERNARKILDELVKA